MDHSSERLLADYDAEWRAEHPGQEEKDPNAEPDGGDKSKDDGDGECRQCVIS